MTAAAAKESLPNVRELRPADETSAEIRKAFYRLVDARKNNASEMERLEAGRPALLLTATAAQIEQQEAAISRRRIFAEQCNVIEAELRQSFTNAKEAEEDHEYAARVSELKAREDRLNADFLENYPGLAAAVIALLIRERELLAAFRELSHMPGAARSSYNLGPAWGHPSGTMLKGYMAANAMPAAISELVRLPSLTPAAPLWGPRW